MSAVSLGAFAPKAFTICHRPTVRSCTARIKPCQSLKRKQVCSKAHNTRCRPSKLPTTIAQAASTAGDATQGRSQSLSDKVLRLTEAFWKFLRPHTIRGTILGAFAVTARALLENQQYIDWGLMPRAVMGLLALLCGNGYIVGINQIYDVDIDAVNKPFLPVAAGELSTGTAWLMVALLAGCGLALTAANFGQLITSLYSFGLFLGTIYSVPPLRLKRFAVPAFLIIATVRGFLLNFGVFYAARAALGLPFQWSPAVGFITTFAVLFATAIAITKDLPDVEGDKKFKIETFATRLGLRNIAFLGSSILLLNYLGAIALALRLPGAFRVPIMVGFHALMGVSTIVQTWKLDSEKYSKSAIAAYYRFIWNLFYAEYAMFVFL